MMMIFVVLGLAAGLFRGGHLGRLPGNLAQLHALWLAPAAYLVKAVLPLAAPHCSGRLLLALPLLVCFLHYGMLFLFLFCNAKTGYWVSIFGGGTALNFIVIAQNYGAMPVSDYALTDAPLTAARLASGAIFAYAPVSASTKLAFLGDVLPFAPFGRLLGFASVGDVLLGVGMALLCFHLTKADFLL